MTQKHLLQQIQSQDSGFGTDIKIARYTPFFNFSTTSSVKISSGAMYNIESHERCGNE